LHRHDDVALLGSIMETSNPRLTRFAVHGVWIFTHAFAADADIAAVLTRLLNRRRTRLLDAEHIELSFRKRGAQNVRVLKARGQFSNRIFQLAGLLELQCPGRCLEIDALGLGVLDYALM